MSPAKSITSDKNLESTLKEVEKELKSLEPQIGKLEKQVEKLQQLKVTKQKLITLKLSLKSILESYSKTSINEIVSSEAGDNLSNFNVSNTLQMQHKTQKNTKFDGKVFVPNEALAEITQHLRRKTSLNYQIYRAIVYYGGNASTEEIRDFLVENGVSLPKSGETFDKVPLTHLSSRVNYLVRKGIVDADGRGNFVSNLGWVDDK